MAPNKRADNKKMIGIYVDKDILRRFQGACAYFGLSMSVVLTSYIEEKANEYQKLLSRSAGDDKSLAGNDKSDKASGKGQ